MNEELEKKLAALREDAKTAGSAPVYAVLQLLHDCYLADKHRAFAKHCCQFSPVEATPGVPSKVTPYATRDKTIQ